MRELPGTESRPPRQITLVASRGCHFCDDALEALSALAATHPLGLVTLDAESSEGHDLVELHRPALFPLVLLDGAFFSAGRLPRRKLAHALRLDRVAV